jgi:hypothetical protein
VAAELLEDNSSCNNSLSASQGLKMGKMGKIKPSQTQNSSFWHSVLNTNNYFLSESVYNIS